MTKQKEQKQIELRLDLYDWLQSIVFVIVACVLVFVFLGRIVTVDGRSMNPTLVHGDKLLVSNISHHYERGDIVGFDAPEFDYVSGSLVKRIIATENETISIDFNTGKVSIDGVELDEPYIAEFIKDFEDYEEPITVPPGHVFCMGDNRNHSLDSRDSSIGMVDLRQIMGKAVFRLYPFEAAGCIG